MVNTSQNYAPGVSISAVDAHVRLHNHGSDLQTMAWMIKEGVDYRYPTLLKLGADGVTLEPIAAATDEVFALTAGPFDASSWTGAQSNSVFVHGNFNGEALMPFLDSVGVTLDDVRSSARRNGLYLRNARTSGA